MDNGFIAGMSRPSFTGGANMFYNSNRAAVQFTSAGTSFPIPSLRSSPSGLRTLVASEQPIPAGSNPSLSQLVDELHGVGSSTIEAPPTRTSTEVQEAHEWSSSQAVANTEETMRDVGPIEHTNDMYAEFPNMMTNAPSETGAEAMTMDAANATFGVADIAEAASNPVGVLGGLAVGQGVSALTTIGSSNAQTQLNSTYNPAQRVSQEKSLTGAQTTTNYSQIGATIGSIVPVVGSAIGAGIGAAIGASEQPSGSDLSSAEETAQL